MSLPEGRVRVWVLALVCFSALMVLAATISASDDQAQSAPLPPPPRPGPNVSGAQPGSEPLAPRPAFQPAPNVSTVTSGTWTPLKDQPFNHSPTFYPSNVFLLTDGTVLAQGYFMTDLRWWKFTPDPTGSYINGTWSQVASPPNCPNNYPGASADTAYSPLDYASAVLPDGRVIIMGGEYNYNYDYVKNDGSFGVWTSQGAIYDPVANSWTCVAPPSGWTQIGDAQSVVLPNGTWMVAHLFDNEVATLDTGTNPPTFNAPFTPPGKASVDTGINGLVGGNDEEGWTLLPDGTVLTTEIYNANDATETPALTYNSNTEAWSSAGIAPDPLTLLTQGTGGNMVNYYEIGPALLRPDGTVFASGATGFNDVYDPSNGLWSSSPSFPTIQVTHSSGSCTISNVTEQLKAADAPAALLPDGNVLIAASPVDSQKACGWVPPTEFFEFDGANLTQVNEPTYAPDVPSYVGRLLVLPTGQVLYANTYNFVEIYTPAGTPNSAWAPTITTSPQSVDPGGTNYQLAGTQFNGLSQAVAYGDNYQAATNYPLVRITNSRTGHVYYARTHNHSTMAVATGNATVSTEFDVPAGIETGASTLVVVANGIASQPVSVNVGSAATCPDVPANTCFSAGKSSVLLTDNPNPSKQKFSWKWSKGTAQLVQADFGDPVNGSTSYLLCVYDESGGSPVLKLGPTIFGGGTCGKKPCWKAVSDKGWAYKNKGGNPDGMTMVTLKGGAAGKPLIKVTGQGSNLVLPAPVSGTKFFNQDTAVIVQVSRTDTATCWSSTFSATGTKTNNGTQFKAVSP
jgi:hypothetical protein